MNLEHITDNPAFAGFLFFSLFMSSYFCDRMATFINFYLQEEEQQ